jgi:PPOX class probable F420-dependent enzyme
MSARKPSVQELAAARYIALRSFRADGSAADVPVWSLPHGETIWVWTSAHSHKVKRLRREPRAQLAICNANGKRLRSDWVDAHVTIRDDETSVREAFRLVDEKYGWQSTAIQLLNKHVRGNPPMLALELSLD